MILDDIQNKLLEVNSKVYYGAVDEKERETVWEYIVFDRQKTSIKENRTGYGDYFSIHYISEEYVPEGTDSAIISKMLEIHGMRLASNDIEYTYTMKPNTNTVVEIMTLSFVRARKCD